MELSIQRPWSLTHSASFPSASSSSSSMPFSLSSLMNSRPLDSNAPLFLLQSPEDSDFTGCVRISQKPLSPCRSPSTVDRKSQTTSQIKLPPNKKRAKLRTFRRHALCPGRRWHRIGDGAPRKLMYVICEEDSEDEDVNESMARSAKRPRLQRSASDSLVPITSAMNSAVQSSDRSVRFAHMVVEYQFPDIEWPPEEEEDDSSSGYSESICSESTLSDSDLDLTGGKDIVAGVPASPQAVSKPTSRLSRLLRGYY